MTDEPEKTEAEVAAEAEAKKPGVDFTKLQRVAGGLNGLFLYKSEKPLDLVLDGPENEEKRNHLKGGDVIIVIKGTSAEIKVVPDLKPPPAEAEAAPAETPPPEGETPPAATARTRR
jgi:hypothetical protein